MAPFLKVLQEAGCLPSHAEGAQETPQQKRRRLLQAAKTRAIEHYWPFTGTVTADMRADARLAIDRELRNEPLEDFTPQEVTELVEGLRDRIYTSYWRRQKEDARRIQEGDAHTRTAQIDQDRTLTERIRKKNAFLDEVRRRASALLKIRPLSILQRIHLLEDLLKHCDAAFTGDEPLSEAYTSIAALLQARVAEWDAEEAAKKAKQQEEWWEAGIAVMVVIAVGVLYAKGPEILLWLLKFISPEPPARPESTQHPSTDAPQQAPDEPLPRRRIRRVRRPPQSTETEGSFSPCF